MLAIRSIVLTILFTLALGASRPADAGSVEQQELNALTAMMATANDLSTVVYTLTTGPLQPQTIGTWSGTVTSSSWDLALSGQLNGISLTITEAGSFDSSTSTTSWTDSGSYGTNPISGSGTATYDAFTLTQVVNAAGKVGDWGISTLGSIVGTPPPLQVAAKGVLHGYLYLVLTSPLHPTPSTPWYQKLLDEGQPPQSPPPPFLIQESGIVNPTTNSLAFTASAVPEPSSLVLAGLGAGGCLGYAWSRQRRQPPTGPKKRRG